MRKLSDLEREAIIEKIRALRTERLLSGASTATKAICHNCGSAKPLVGSVYYDKYRLCSDCAICYELAKASGDIKNIEDFVLT